MSGIAGIWGRPEAARLRVMATALAHRGPDDERFWMQPSAGVGFAIRRLAIIDLPGGHQPIANEDGTIVTICDGEIYNYRELRDELAARGHAFRSASDTEVIVHLYEEQGPAFLTRLRGMFALAVWDGRLGQLLLARDRAGKKPLYYAESPGEFRFASEIQALVRVQEGAVEIDRQALLDYLAWVVVPAPRTIYRQVRVVLPGHALIVRAREVIESRPYWQLEYTPKTPLSEREAVDRVDDLLREAVRLRLRSDVPVGVFLSGGIDSGLITAMAAQESAGPIRTLAVGFEQSEFDERPLARQVADRYGTEHHELVVRPDARTLLPEIAAAYDQPFADSSAVPSYCAAQAARPFVRVVLNGDGGDEVFAGYRRRCFLAAGSVEGDGPASVPAAFLSHALRFLASSGPGAVAPAPRAISGVGGGWDDDGGRGGFGDWGLVARPGAALASRRRLGGRLGCDAGAGFWGGAAQRAAGENGHRDDGPWSGGAVAISGSRAGGGGRAVSESAQAPRVSDQAPATPSGQTVPAGGGVSSPEAGF